MNKMNVSLDGVSARTIKPAIFAANDIHAQTLRVTERFFFQMSDVSLCLSPLSELHGLRWGEGVPGGG